uniref:77 kDa echinoderm microtubule-associated protein n=1 Tax=Hirondellea gigas TaxID=1518452 RepID=A0A2P2I5U5_9CRUS
MSERDDSALAPRISQLEQLTNSQSELITTLLSRITKLEETVDQLSISTPRKNATPRMTPRRTNANRKSLPAKGANDASALAIPRSERRAKSMTNKNSAPIGSPRQNMSLARRSSRKRLSGAPKSSPRRAEIDSSRKSTYHVGGRTQHVISPSWFTEAKDDADPPRADLELEHVYGYNGKDGRTNVFCSRDGSSVIYYVAAVSIVLNIETNQQKLFVGHNEDISSLSVCPSAPFAVTGQLDPKGSQTAYVCVWNYETMEEICRIEDSDHIQKAVLCVSFGANAEYLYCIDQGPDLSVYRGPWQESQKKLQYITSAKIAKSQILGIVINPHFERYFEEIGNQKVEILDEFVTLGKSHLKYWTLQKRDDSIVAEGRMVSGRPRLKESIQTTLCAKFFPNRSCIIGTAMGQIYIICKNELVFNLQIQQNAIGAIELTSKGFISGGFDGVIFYHEITENDPEKFRCDVEWEHKLPVSTKYGVKAISLNESSDEILIGTRSCEIFALGMKTKKLNQIVQGHFDEVWGLAVHPNRSEFMTTSYDGTVRLWTSNGRKLLRSKSFAKERLVCVDISNIGKQFALGFQSGRVVVLDFESFEPVFDRKLAPEQISVIRYSPSDAYLAIGSWDQTVRLLHWSSQSKTFKVGKVLKGNTSSITSMQWSSNGKIVSTSSKSYEVLNFDIQTKSLVSPIDPDTKWHKWSNLLGWQVQGLFGKADGVHVNSVSVSESGNLCVSGNDSGELSLMRFPCLHPPARKVFPEGHSSCICSALFTMDNSYVLSTGGHDYSIMQWKVKGLSSEANSHESKINTEEKVSVVDETEPTEVDPKKQVETKKAGAGENPAAEAAEADAENPVIAKKTENTNVTFEDSSGSSSDNA